MTAQTQDKTDKRHAEWEAEWVKQDFSWEGLKKHEWRAPVDFPGPGKIIGEGDNAYRESNVQEYWRWSLGVPGFEDENRLLTNDEL